MSRILVCLGPRDALGNTIASNTDTVVVANSESYNCINRDQDTATSVSLVDAAGVATNLSLQTASAFTAVIAATAPASDLHTYSRFAIQAGYYISGTATLEISGSDAIVSIKALGYNTSGRDTDFSHNSITLTHDSDGSGAPDAVGPPVEFTNISSAPRVVSVSPASGSTFGYVSVLEITTEAAPTGPTLDTIPATAFPDETLTLGVTGAGATQGTGSVTINGVTQTISSWSDTSIDITVVQGDTPYGAGNTVTLTTDSGDTDTGTVELVANTAGGFGFVDMASPNTADESSVAFGATPTVVTGDQFEWEDFNTLGNLVVNAEGFVSSVDTEGAFRGRFWDATDSTWGAVETFTASIQGTVPQGTLIVQDVSVGRVSATANVSYSGTDFTRVQYSLDGQNWVNFTPPLLVVDGLERETAYTATVRVINDDGTGPTESFSFTTQTSGTIDAPVTPEDGAKYSAQRFNRQTGGGLIGLRSWKTRK